MTSTSTGGTKKRSSFTGTFANTEFDKFESLAGKLLKVSKSEIEAKPSKSPRKKSGR